MASSPSVRRPVAPRLPALRWPLPALLAWAAGWVVMLALLRTDAAAPALAVAAGLAVAALPALAAATFWRRVIVAGGFPVSLLASGVGGAIPAWAWLLPLAALALAYPVTAWRDAPVFPTPRDALAGLDRHITLAPAASVLDAGCGLGHGLRALRAVWPQARIAGVEWSWPLALATRLRCPWARVTRGDMWRGSWAAHDLVYLFQRPESMARALAKADAEMRPGSWVVSLEFEAAGRTPHARMALASGRPIWIYRVGS
ncbi:class I SAM-dependent methyltransferase [Scleromatobacter humisilvae]|uniref:Class I SAM-dependent methyltransferase n=1 Tax=Scleromatobacter humisilvae TaxID=2897159 RepID=A0A9X1YFH4_9BURK|nr:class I SAM-dependent methyltransferase [Scleromatobacter humisilvae]MCK9684717.1 class I SAM-dependent methyltransferase [Scleromatobacter humisilvae]